MKSLGKLLTMGLCSLGLVVLVSSNAFAIKAQAEDPKEGSPPYGMAISTDAKGTKLTGVLCVEYYDFMGDDSATAKVVLRLRQGNELHSFFKTVPISDINDLPLAQEEIMIAMAYNELTDDIKYTGVLETFFGNQNHTFTVKNLEEYDKVGTCQDPLGACSGDEPYYFLMDVVVAVQ